MRVFVDTWAWVALALKRDAHHTAAREPHAAFRRQGARYVTSDHVVGETITNLYRAADSASAVTFVSAILRAIDDGAYELERIDPDRFRRAWELRRQLSDKPTVSFVDLTSMIVMQERKIAHVFTGDRHFEQVNLGWQTLP